MSDVDPTEQIAKDFCMWYHKQTKEYDIDIDTAWEVFWEENDVNYESE